MGQHRPSDSGNFVGQSDASLVDSSSFNKVANPLSEMSCAEQRTTSGMRTQSSSGAMDKQGSRVGISSFADTEVAGFAAGRVLPGHKSEKSRKFPTVFELSSDANCAEKNGSRHYPHAGDVHQVFAIAMGGDEVFDDDV